MDNILNISSGPHIRDKWTTPWIMGVVSLSLLPATFIGIAYHGIHALWVVIAAVVAAVATEFVFDKIAHKPATYMDGSAIVTGLMLALSLSPSVPLYIPIIGSFFAIFVVKCCFGGLGKNFVNPALAARCFLLISFGKTMTEFKVDGVSAATPVAELLSGKTVNVTQMFIGNTNGVIGSSVIALLLGGVVLWALDIIHGQICFSVLIGFTVFIGLFGGQGFDPEFLLAHICGGGVVLGAFYMATDYTTSPVSRLGQFTYGMLIGILGALFRLFGSAADSFSYSVIIANLFTPLIDMYIIPKPYAYRKSAIALQNGEEKKPLLKRIPKSVVVLTSIALIAGLALSGVYSMTKDTIEEQKRQASLLSYQAVVPEAVTFEMTPEIETALAESAGQVWGSSFGRAYINEAYVGKDESGNIVGYIVNITTADGNDADITLTIGLNADGVMNGISFTALNETPGMGMRCGDPDFMEQFVNKDVSKFNLLKAGGAAKPEEINAISGATVTSSAVVNAVNAGLDFYSSVMKGAM